MFPLGYLLFSVRSCSERQHKVMVSGEPQDEYIKTNVELMLSFKCHNFQKMCAVGRGLGASVKQLQPSL